MLVKAKTYVYIEREIKDEVYIFTVVLCKKYYFWFRFTQFIFAFMKNERVCWHLYLCDFLMTFVIFMSI